MDWFRYYTDTIDNRKIQSLPGIMHRVWSNFLCLNRIYGGTLPDLETIAFRLRCTVTQAERWRTELIERKLIDPLPGGQYAMHEWEHYQYQSDDSRERVRAFRQRQKQRRGNGNGNGGCNVTVTAQNRTDTETEAEQNRECNAPPLSPFPPDGEFDPYAAFMEVWNAYPAKGRVRQVVSQGYYAEAVHDRERHEHVMRRLREVWYPCDKWQKGFIVNLPDWIINRSWDEEPPTSDGKSTLARVMEEL